MHKHNQTDLSVTIHNNYVFTQRNQETHTTNTTTTDTTNNNNSNRQLSLT